ncbi:MAG: tellurite resistance TerB family protein, partial [Thauera sp.]|nr:tellurite resistance TerB family protein [Thauera sp.]
SGRTSGGGSTAGMAILATIAMAALKNWTDNRREQASMAGAAASFSPEDLETMTAPDTEALMVRAMASAAKADGRIEEDEVQRIVGKVGADGLSEEEKQFLISELRAPLDLAALVADVPNEMVAAEVYAASLLAIDLDTQEEVAYLRQLAQALRLDGATVARLHQITGATPV